MRTFIVLSLLLFGMTGKAQELNKKLEDKIRQKEILLNRCTREGLVSLPEFKASYDANYAHYQVDSTVLPELKQLMNGKKIKVVLGTWCGDSKLQVPFFLKVMDALQISEKQVEFIAVDGKKEAENGLLNGLKIERVPTFILSDSNNQELGRIVESPQQSIEKDLLQFQKKVGQQ